MTQVSSALPGQPPEHEPVLPGQAVITAGQPGQERRPALLMARSLFALTKPRIIELLLVTTLPVMILARHGIPSLRLDRSDPGRRAPWPPGARTRSTA